MTSRPNVLVLMCDQMQAGRLGCAGDPVADTPFLDSLATEGVRFTHMVSAHGQCVPSRASFITGLPPHECGVVVNYGFYQHQNRLNPARHRTLGHVFSDAGYHTAYFGKCHFGVSIDSLGYGEGIDHDNRRVEDDEAQDRGMAHVPKSLRRDYVAAEDAVEWLQKYEPESERPLFFTFSTNLPHPPFFHEPKHAVEADTLELPVSYYEETFATKPTWQKQHADGSHSAGDETQAREELAQYYSMIAMMDEHYRRVADEFKRLGLWENTIVLFVADHGDMMGAHGISKKGTLPYEELYRVPCIMKLADGQQARRAVVDDLLSSVQLAGSLSTLAEVDARGAFPHGDLCAALDSDQHPDDEIVFFEHHAAYWGVHPFYGAHTRDFKYVKYFGDADAGFGDAHAGQEELYHLATDPHELVNVAGLPEHAATRGRLAEAADAWWQNTGGRDFAWYESDTFRNNQHNTQ
jgi:arylsulfatase A-like enzyme